MKAERRFWPEAGQHVWDRIRDEFTLPPLDEVEQRFEALYGDPDTMTRKVVRVFIEEGTYCPGFQFRDGQLDERVLALFDHAMALGVPHNVFAAWMVAGRRSLNDARPVDMLGHLPALAEDLTAFAAWYKPH